MTQPARDRMETYTQIFQTIEAMHDDLNLIPSGVQYIASLVDDLSDYAHFIRCCCRSYSSPDDFKFLSALESEFNNNTILSLSLKMPEKFYNPKQIGTDIFQIDINSSMYSTELKNKLHLVENVVDFPGEEQVAFFRYLLMNDEDKTRVCFRMFLQTCVRIPLDTIRELIQLFMFEGTMSTDVCDHDTLIALYAQLKIFHPEEADDLIEAITNLYPKFDDPSLKREWNRYVNGSLWLSW